MRSAFGFDCPVLQDDDFIAVIQETNLMGDQNHCLGLTQNPKASFFNLLSYLGIDCRNRIIEDIDI